MDQLPFRSWVNRLLAPVSTSPLRRKPPCRAAVRLERLEDRQTPAVTWAPLAGPGQPSGNISTMLLMPNGQDLVEDVSDRWYLLTPDGQGNYVNGGFAPAGSFAGDGHAEFPANVLPTDQLFVLGGRSSPSVPLPLPNTPGANVTELYTLTSDRWSAAAPHPEGGYMDAPTELLPPDSQHPAGSILAGGNNTPILVGTDDLGRPIYSYPNGPETYLYDIATNTWSQTDTKLRGDGTYEESWVILPDNSILSYDLWASSPGNFHAQRYIQVGAPLPGGGTSTGQWVDASTTDGSINYLLHDPNATPERDSPVMVRLPKGGLTLPNGQRLPDGAILAMGGNGKTAFYIPPSAPGAADDHWTAGPDIQIGGSLRFVDEGPAAVLPNGKVVVVVSGDGDAFLYQFDPTGTGPTWTDLTSTFNGQATLGQSAGIWRLLVNPNGHLLVANGNSSQIYDFSDDTGTISAGWRPTVTGFTNNNDGTYTLAGARLTGLDEGAVAGDEAEMASNYPIVRLTSAATGAVTYARTSGWTPGVAEGASGVHVVLPATLPQGTYALSVIANGIASDPVTFDYAGPLYVDTHFTTQNYPTGAVPDADPVLAGSQPAAIGTTAFASVNAAIAAAQPGQVIIVNGANGDTDSGVFHEAVAVNKVVEVYLQQGPVAFDSLAGTAGGASIELHGVGLTVGDDDTTTAYAGTFTGTGGLTKKGAGTLTLSSDNSGTYSGDVTITGGAIQLNNGKALANSAVTVNSNFGLAFLNTLTTATLGSLAGSGNINLLSTALTVGGNNTGTGLNPITYSGNLTGTALGSITKVGKGMWELSGNNGGYHGGWRSTPGWWRWVLNSPWPAAPSP